MGNTIEILDIKYSYREKQQTIKAALTTPGALHEDYVQSTWKNRLWFLRIARNSEKDKRELNYSL